VRQPAAIRPNTPAVTTDDYVIQLATGRGLVTPGQVESTRDRLERTPDPRAARPELLDVLVAERSLSARDLALLVAGEFDLPVIEPGSRPAPRTALELVPGEFARRHRLLPWEHDERRLRVAMANPLDAEGIDSLAQLTGLDVEAAVAPWDELGRAIETAYGADRPAPAAGASPFGAGAREEGEAGAVETEDRNESDAPIIALVHELILEAVRRHASDIHFEPLEKRFRVRCRVDGMLVEVGEPPKRLQAAIVSRLKIMSDISIAEKRLPQDGRIQLQVAGRQLDLRVSSLPTAHGESVVMRILDKRALHPQLSDLGLTGEDRLLLERLIKLPEGMLLVTGPTGSGKTTTLYSCLHHLNRSDRKIITVEDPVEYQLSGINQVQVRQEIGMTFAAALRAMLRQSPNIVMIGEIRDRETAEIAIHASLTGHLVLSTLHTNDAAGAVIRLTDLGVKPFLVAAALRAVLAQRLVRRICPDCRRPHRPGRSELERLGVTPADGAAFMQGCGCSACEGTGYRGRIGIFELLPVDDAIAARIHAPAGPAQLRAMARAAGWRSLREDGLAKARAGLTTIGEVVTNTVDDAC